MIWLIHLALAVSALSSDEWGLQETQKERQQQPHEHQPSLVPS